MTNHPYQDLPNRAFWRRSVSGVPMAEVDPVGDFRLSVGREMKVTTAGSCFAQHIARYLAADGYNYFIAEPGHPILPDNVRREAGYGIYSCRYGNIYTARQLWQLFERAYGRFQPQEDVWFKSHDVVVDPFRPTVQKGGFVSEFEMRLDRDQHLAAARHMFSNLDVFIFTLGLTECWRSRLDGAVFPICPGVEAGEFDPRRHEFYNQPVEDVISDLNSFCAGLLNVNPDAQIVFTVSPVPLVATAEVGEHVMTATNYSKSVLRVAAESVRRNMPSVHYFPSFEIIAGSFNRGAYFAEDLRNVVETGVEHVMRLFMYHATGGNAATAPGAASSRNMADHLAVSQQIVDVECDEVALDRS